MTWAPQVSGQGDIILKHLVEGNIMVMNAPLIKSDLLRKVGGFDENLKSYGGLVLLDMLCTS